MKTSEKYRGVDESTGKWIYSDGFLKHKDGTIILCIGHREKDIMATSPIIPSTLGQCSGLKGKDKTDIYGGDIIECNGVESVVFFNELTACFDIQEIEGSGEAEELYLTSSESIVVGNTYDRSKDVREMSDKIIEAREKYRKEEITFEEFDEPKKKKRYFVLFFAAYYRHSLISGSVNVSAFGGYVSEKETRKSIEKEGVSDVIFTNIIELNEEDYRRWKNES